MASCPRHARLPKTYLSSAPPISGTDTSEPTPHGTDSAISCVITYEICSLLPPCASMLSATTRRKDSSERPIRPFPSGTGLASPRYPTHRVGISNRIKGGYLRFARFARNRESGSRTATQSYHVSVRAVRHQLDRSYYRAPQDRRRSRIITPCSE
jgi:hypothetical protein